MTEQERLKESMRAIHQIVLPGFIAAAENGHNSTDILAYMQAATNGMELNACFCLDGPALAGVLRLELVTP